MAIGYNPRVSTSGLIFYYDMSNSQKSWRGKPTVNYISNPTEEMPRGEFGQYRDLAPTFNTYGLVPYSLSMDIKANKSGSVLVYMQNGSTTKYAFVSSSVNVTTEYQRFYFNNITPSISTPSDTAATLATYTGYGSGVTPTVKNIQLEQGTFATPFVDGTRSNTQAILDLTNNNTVTATNLSYSNDGKFSFDGTDDYATVNAGMANFTSGITINALAYFNSSSGSWVRILDFGNGNPLNNFLFCRYADSNSLFWGIYPGTGSVYMTGSSISWNNWAVYTATADGTNMKIYKNGVLENTYATSVLPDNVTRNNNYIGKSNWVDPYFNGSISNVQIYNRALTATEVYQNFQALRGRYGI